MDKSGFGYLRNDAGATFFLPASVQPDPGPGGLPAVLTYDMLAPPSLVAGDVLIVNALEGLNDVIRFNPAGTGSPGYPASMLFYSDNTDGLDIPGDTPSPPSQFYANQVTITEVGPEGNNRAFYTPLPGQPGFVAGFNVEYIFVSDGSVPEPGTIGLMAVGLGLIGVRMIRRRSRA